MGSLDILSLLSCPPTKTNANAVCINQGNVFAFGSGSAISVIDVQNLNVVTTLVGHHRNAEVSALAWHPGLGSREPRSSALVRLASGDDEGRVAVWNVNTGSAIAVLEDSVAAGFIGIKRSEVYKPTVQGLAWVTAVPTLLAILIAPAYLIFWDYKANSVIWRKDFTGNGEIFTGIAVNSLDRRQFCIHGDKGSFIVFKAVNPAIDKVKQQHYSVDIGQQGMLRCFFSTTNDILFVLLHREIIMFDLEFGQPAASTSVPESKPGIQNLLGCFGHAASGKGLQDGGIDVLYCSHVDGSISIWQRKADLLAYGLVGMSKLLPPPPKFQASSRAPHLVSLALGTWRGLSSVKPVPHPGHDETLSSWNPFVSCDDNGGRDLNPAQAADSMCHSVLVMGVCSEGQVWQWQLPLLEGTIKGIKPPMPCSALLGLHQNFPFKVVNFSVCSSPILLSSHNHGELQVVAALAAATALGTIEIVTVAQGSLSPLQAIVTASIAVHKGTVPGIRWLGSTPRILSFSTEKAQTGFKNIVLLTDIRNRVSVALRDSPADPAPVVAVRGSPSGRYVLVVFRGMPSEIWSVGGGDRPVRLRQIDLQFVAVEWVGECGTAVNPAEKKGWGRWAPSPLAQQRAAEGYPVLPDAKSPRGDEMPDERLAFSLADGKIGVLSIKGRRFQDTRPKRPIWIPLATGEYHATAVAGWNHLIFFGDAEGGLVKWDTSTGRTFVLETGQGRIRKIYVSPPPCEHLHASAASVQARVAVLFNTGSFAVYDVDQSNELRPTSITVALANSRVGRVADVEWLPLPDPVGGGSVLAALLADGSIALVDTIQSADVGLRQQRLLRYKTVLNFNQGSEAPRLALGEPLVSPLLLPKSWVLLLRVLLQRGVPDSLFHDLKALASESIAGLGCGTAKQADMDGTLSKLEERIWSHLPPGCLAAWELLLARHSEEREAFGPDGPMGGEAAARDGRLAQILDDFAYTAEDDMESLDAVPSASRGNSHASPEVGATPAAPLPQSPSPGGARRKLPRAFRSSGSTSLAKKEPVIDFKSIGAAFANMATASRAKFSKKVGAGRGGQGEAAGPQGRSVAEDGQECLQSKSAFQCLVTVLQAAGYMRSIPSVLSDAELAQYSRALSLGCTASRMAVAAELAGSWEERQFWTRLPATLAWLKTTLDQARSRVPSAPGDATPGAGGRVQAGAGPSGTPGLSHINADPPRDSFVHAAAETNPFLIDERPANQQQLQQQGRGVPCCGRRLWEEQLQLAEESERSTWHEQMQRSVFEQSEQLQEKRVLRYVALGDFHTAVGFLLASGPEDTARYYRNALCTLAMSFACGTQQAQQGQGFTPGGEGGAPAAMVQAPGGPAVPAGSAAGAIQDATARTLFCQAAKVITANAASVGDSLLGVPLLCSTGQHAEAVQVLQDAGLWHYAAALTALQLKGLERAAALERWAAHVGQEEGRVWAALGLLVAAGSLKVALQMLQEAGLPDAAFALIACCWEAGVPVEQHNLETGELPKMYSQAGGPVQQYSSSGMSGGGTQVGMAPRRSQTDYEANAVARDFQLYICDVLQQL